MRIKKAAIFSDTHIGAPGFDDRVFSEVVKLRDRGYQIIFLGDVYDFVREEKAFERGPNIFKEGDIYVNGNHDFFFDPPEYVDRYRFSFKFISGGKRFYLTHGDAVDFVYAFKMLEEHKGPWFVKLLSYLGRWKTIHYQRLYKAMEELPDSVIEAFEHSDMPTKLRMIKWGYTLIKSMWKPYKPFELPEHNEKIKDYGPVVTFSPKHILRRVLWFEDSAKFADVIIIGHLHRPTFGINIFNGKQYEVYVTGAWIGENTPRTYLIVEDGKVFFRTLD